MGVSKRFFRQDIQLFNGSKGRRRVAELIDKVVKGLFIPFQYAFKPFRRIPDPAGQMIVFRQPVEKGAKPHALDDPADL